MGLFDKNPNEIAYVGGKKHWSDVIKNSGSGELLIWRQPEEDFNTNSTLIVMPGEEAIFIKNGMVEQVFENGRYVLTTENYPFISRIVNAFTGGISTFNCVVYFVRKTDSKEIRWGSSSPIQVRDKVWGVRTEAKARGAYKVRIENPTKFLVKLIGNNVNFQTQDGLDKYFSNEFQGKIKTEVSKFINSYENELVGLDAYLDELSKKITPHIDEVLEEYGLKCVNFLLSGLDIDTTKYDTIDESQMELIARKRGYQGDKAGIEMLGEDWTRVQGVNILKDIANNHGAGGAAATGAGIGIGIGAVGAIGSIAQEVFAQTINCTEQNEKNNQVSDEKFVKPNIDNKENELEVLSKLKEMLEHSLIEQSEYDKKKQEILNRM